MDILSRSFNSTFQEQLQAKEILHLIYASLAIYMHGKKDAQTRDQFVYLFHYNCVHVTRINTGVFLKTILDDARRSQQSHSKPTVSRR